MTLSYDACLKCECTLEKRTDVVDSNGYRERTLKTSIGVLTLQKPQLRKTPFKTCVFDSHSRIDKALKSAILKSYIKGVGTRNVQDIIRTLGDSEISAASVSRIAKTLDEAVETFLKRPIEKPTPYRLSENSLSPRIKRTKHYQSGQVKGFNGKKILVFR